MRAGQDPAQFWKTTPAIINLTIRSFLEQEEAINKRFLSLAWHIEALARHKRLPNLDRLLGGRDEAQTDEEMDAALMSWVAMHNAKYEHRRLLGIAEVGEC